MSLESIYHILGVTVFWTLAIASCAALVACACGLMYAIVHAFIGAKDWIALAAVDRFTGMTESQRNAAFHRATEVLYQRGKFDAKLGQAVVETLKVMVAQADAALLTPSADAAHEPSAPDRPAEKPVR